MEQAQPRARALISALPGQRTALEAAMHPHVASALSTTPGLAWGTRIAGDPLADTPHRAALGPPENRFDLFVEADSAQALARFVAPLAPFVDTARSAVVVGAHHLLMPLHGPYLMIFALRPHEDMSRPDFLEYWTKRHGPLIVAAARGRGSYYQLHADPADTAALARTLGFGIDDLAGNAGGWITEPEKLGLFFRHHTTLDALADERAFIDHSRSTIDIYRIERSA